MEILINLMIFLPCLGALGCVLVRDKDSAKWIALLVSLVTLVFSLIIALKYWQLVYKIPDGEDTVRFITAVSWIKAINVEFRTGVDGLSLPLVVLTAAISVMVVLASWKIDKMTKGFMALYLILLTGMLGVFLSLDLFLFYVFFEIGLLPMYFLIGLWGGSTSRSPVACSGLM